MDHVNGTSLSKETVKESLAALRGIQNQYKGTADRLKALQNLVNWLERQEGGSASEDEELLDENSLAYLQSYRDQFTRFSLFSRGHGELVGDSPKVIGGHRDSIEWLVNPLLAEELKKVLDWDRFNVFRVATLAQGRPLETVTLAVLHHFDLVEKLHLPTRLLQSYLRDVESAYQDNPYHNSTHAADVVQGLACLLEHNAFTAQLTDLEMLSMIMACAIHDVGHPGVTNEYLINTNAEPALRYNDQSINENGHAALGFQLLRTSSNNFIESLPEEEYRFVRRTVIAIVLSTDMVGHAKLTKDFAACVRQFGADLQHWPEDKRVNALQMLVHCCDIGNPAKPLPYSLQWTERIMKENFAQGDRELAEGLSVSPLCNKDKVDVPKSQITFLDYVVRPCFEALKGFAPATAAAALYNIDAAHAYWTQLRKRGSSTMLFTLDDVR